MTFRLPPTCCKHCGAREEHWALAIKSPGTLFLKVINFWPIRKVIKFWCPGFWPIC